MAQALALKYRPREFSDLIGQESVSQTLSLALDNSRISHAYLFSGLRGSGKTSSARIFARSLQCEKGPTSTPCGECNNCKSALEGKHPDIIEMDGASRRKIEDIRDLIEQTKYFPSYGRYKIFIIDEVHMLTKEAFNSLLKTLEEPPEYVKFILATTDPLKLPATILSRTQHFRFKRIPHKLVTLHITHILDKEEVKFEDQALEIIARSGQGSLRDTLTITDMAINFCNKFITTSKVSEMLGVVDPQTLNAFFEAIFQKNENKLQEILTLLETYECEMIIEEMVLFLKDALKNKLRDFPILLVDRFLRILTESKYLLELNSDNGFVLLLLSLKMQEALKVKDIDSLITELESKISFEDHSKVVQEKKTTPITQASPLQTNSFKTLIDKIYDRNKELGEIFEKNIKFISFQDSILCWESHAKGDDKEFLRKNYIHIKTIVQEIYGISTKIQPVSIEQTSQIQDMPEQNSLKSSEMQNINEKDSKNIVAKKFPEEIIESLKSNLGVYHMKVFEGKNEE